MITFTIKDQLIAMNHARQEEANWWIKTFGLEEDVFGMAKARLAELKRQAKEVLEQ